MKNIEKGTMMNTYWLLKFNNIARMNLDPKTFEGFLNPDGCFAKFFEMDELNHYLRSHRMQVNGEYQILKGKIMMGKLTYATEAQYKAYSGPKLTPDKSESLTSPHNEKK